MLDRQATAAGGERPNKGMKLTKPVDLGASKPQCWTDLS
jgi:hypothetical protein